MRVDRKRVLQLLRLRQNAPTAEIPDYAASNRLRNEELWQEKLDRRDSGKGKVRNDGTEFGQQMRSRPTARVLAFESSFRWHSVLFLTLFCSILAHISEIQLVCDGRTDRRTDRRTHPLIEMRERI